MEGKVRKGEWNGKRKENRKVERRWSENQGVEKMDERWRNEEIKEGGYKRKRRSRKEGVEKREEWRVEERRSEKGEGVGKGGRGVGWGGGGAFYTGPWSLLNSQHVLFSSQSHKRSS